MMTTMEQLTWAVNKADVVLTLHTEKYGMDRKYHSLSIELYIVERELIKATYYVAWRLAELEEEITSIQLSSPVGSKEAKDMSDLLELLIDEQVMLIRERDSIT